jgi:K+-sensing histidine kinase KdpD
MKDGGTLTAAVESLGDDWQVSFIDTGTGMTPQQIEKIFEPFQSNFEGGTGLGLAIVYQIVQAHEGKVWARSKPGQGTTFVLRLRRLDAERAATGQPNTEVIADKARVLAAAGVGSASGVSALAGAGAGGRLRG